MKGKEEEKKRLIESGPLTPTTRFFKKEEHIEHENSIGKSTSKLMRKESLEVGNSDYRK